MCALSNLQAADCCLVGVLHCFQRQMLIDFQALLARVSRNELDLGVGQPPRRKIGEHLVPEQMGMYVLSNSRALPIVLDDLLYAARRSEEHTSETPVT